MKHTPVILQIIPALNAGGAERTVIEVAEAVVMAGGRALVATEGGRLEGELAGVGGEFIHLPAGAKNPLTILANARSLENLVASHGVDIIHARSRAPAWSGLIAARRSKRPFVTTYHGIYNQKIALKGWYNGVMARGDIVIANSHYTAGIVRERHATPDSRLRVIPRGVDLARFAPSAVSPDRITALREKWGLKGTPRIVLLAARLTRWKGQQTAIDAAAKLLGRPDCANVVFILAGDDQGRVGYRDALNAQIDRLGLSGQVIVPGHCEDMPAALTLAAVALVPSIEAEAFGRISIEAQAMGCPVIVSRNGALPETIVEARTAEPNRPGTGWTVPAGDDEALAATIITALTLPESRKRGMAEAARTHAQTFSKQALQQKTLEVYDSLLGSSLARQFAARTAQIGDSPPWSARIPN